MKVKDEFWFSVCLFLGGLVLVFFLAPMIRIEDPAAYGTLTGIWSTGSWYLITLGLGLVLVVFGAGAAIVVLAEQEGEKEEQICLLDYLCDKPWPMKRGMYLVDGEYEKLFLILRLLGVRLSFTGLFPPEYKPVLIRVQGPGERTLSSVTVQGNRHWKKDLLSALHCAKEELMPG